MVFIFKLKRLCLTFSLCLFLSVDCFAVENVTEVQQSYLDSEVTKYDVTDYSTLVKTLQDAIINCKEVKIYYTATSLSSLNLNQLWREIFNPTISSASKDYVADFVDNVLLSQTNHYVYNNSEWVISDTSCTIGLYNINYSSESDSEDAELVNMKLDKVIASLDLEHLTRYEKVLKIHDWICDNFYYDDSFKNTAMYDGFEDGKMICVTYSSIFYNMCQRAGVPCRLITGVGNGELHGWNLVQMWDGKWYYIDVTWNDSLSSKQYFLVGGNMLYTSHKVDSIVLSCLNMFYDIPYVNYTYVEPINPLVMSTEKSFIYNEKDDSEIKITGIVLNDAKGFTVSVDSTQISPTDYTVVDSEEGQICILNSSFLHTLTSGMHKVSIVFDDERDTEVTFDLTANKLTFPNERKTNKLTVGGKFTLTKSYGVGYTVRFSSSNSNIIKVSKSGVVTAVKKGKASVTVVVTKGEYVHKSIVKFNISPKKTY